MEMTSNAGRFPRSAELATAFSRRPRSHCIRQRAVGDSSAALSRRAWNTARGGAFDPGEGIERPVVPSIRSVVAFFAAALVVFGLGNYYIATSDNSRVVVDAEPLFARSVEQAELPAERWPRGRLEVPYYGPMVELLSLGAAFSRQPVNEQRSNPGREAADKNKAKRDQRRAARPVQRAKAKRRGEDDDAIVDPRDAYARGEPGERDARSSRDRRRPDEQRSRKREPRASVGEERQQRWSPPRPESGEGSGFNPMRLFGGFERR